MKKSLLPIALLALVGLPLFAQRATTEAKWNEGTAKIEYGIPSWRASFSESMQKEKTWRLGSNDPTGLALSCALQTNEGPIPAGDYKLAMARNDDGKWDLVIYRGNSFYSEGMPAWHIRPASATDAKDPLAPKLDLNLAGGNLDVAFGPHHITYPMKPIRMHEPATATFGGTPTTIQVMAIPASNTMKAALVGTAAIEAWDRRSGNSAKVMWNMHLTIDGESCTLDFKNPRAAAIEAEKNARGARIERLSKMLESADDARKASLTEFLEAQNKELAALDVEATMTSLFQEKKSVSGSVTARDEAASTLEFSHERVEGGMKLVFGAGEKTATFDVEPREFRN
jgi:hypothetical protein